MKQRFGALLCLIVGSILIAGGLDSGAGGTVGIVIPPPGACGSTAQVGAIVNPGNCPTGEIDLSETTVVTANPGVATPTWHVSVSALGDTPCNLPASGTSQVIENSGTVKFTGLFIYGSTDPSDVTPCQYEITESTVPDFTASYFPAAPYSFVYVPTINTSPPIQRNAVRPNALPGASPLIVTLTNTAAKAATTAAPSSTPVTSAAPSSTGVTSRSSTGSASASVSGVGTAGVSSSAVAVPTSAGASAIVAATGPRSPVRGSLIAGIMLVALGLVLLLAGRRRTRPQHGRG